MFVEAIRGHITDESPYHDDLCVALVRLMVDEALGDEVYTMRQELTERYDTSGIRLRCDDDILQRATLAGRAYVNPYEAFNADDIDKLRHVFNKDVSV
jgi:hypothetical protein